MDPSFRGLVWRCSCIQLRGYPFMATIQIQTVGQAPVTSAGSMIAASTPMADDSFAVTLGRALENGSVIAQDGVFISPELPQNLNTDANANSGSGSDSGSMPGILLNCFADSLLQMSPSVTTSAPIPQVQQDFQNSQAELTVPSAADAPYLPGIPQESTGNSTSDFAPASNAAAMPVRGTGRAHSAPAGREFARRSTIAPAQNAQMLKPASRVKCGTAKADAQSPVTTPGQATGFGVASAQIPLVTSTSLPTIHSSSLPGTNYVQKSNRQPEEEVSAPPAASNPGTGSSPLQMAGPGILPISSWWPQGGSGASTNQTAPSALGSNHQESSNFNQFTPSTGGSATSLEQQTHLASTPPVEMPKAPTLTANLNFNSGFSSGNVPEASTASAPPDATFGVSTGASQSDKGLNAPAQTQISNPHPAQQPAPVQGAMFVQGPEGSPGLVQSIPPEGRFDPAPDQAEAQTEGGQNPSMSNAPSTSRTQTSQTAQVADSSEPAASHASAFTAPTPPTLGPRLQTLVETLPNAQASVQVTGNNLALTAALTNSVPATETVPAPAQSNAASRSSAPAALLQSVPKSGDLPTSPSRGSIHPGKDSNIPANDESWQQFTEPDVASARVLNSGTSTAAPQTESKSSQAPTANSPQQPASTELAPSSAASPAGPVESTNNSSSGNSQAAGQGKAGPQGWPAPAENPPVASVAAPAQSNSPSASAGANPLSVTAPEVSTTHSGAFTPSPQTQTPTQPPATLAAWQNYDGGPGKIVQSASLNNSAAGAEMHLELRTSPLGPVEVHTVVHDGSVGAEIHVQGSEAHTLLTAGLPSLERALGERNLRVENLSVYQDSTGAGTTGGGAQDPHSGAHSSMQRQNFPWERSPQSNIPSSSSTEEEEPVISTTGLSVRV